MIVKYSIQNLLVFVTVTLLQLLVFNNVNVFNLGFPMIYPLTILLIPIAQPIYLVLPLAFLAGLSIDFFTDTGGIHAAALTALAFARIFALNRLEPQAEYTKEDRPGYYRFGPRWIVSYLLILLLVHNFVYFFIEESAIRNIVEVLMKTSVSTLISFVLVFALNLFIFRS